MDADRGGSASSFMPTGGGQIFPARMDADRGGEKIFLSKECLFFNASSVFKNFFDKKFGKNSPETVRKWPKPLIFQCFHKIYRGGVDKRFYPVLIFNHADGVKPRNKTTETKGERNNE